ncbi:hypothetical protein [Methylophaga lonarensis]|uniref:hypothetical protein n=1 Tax=Methylophaga lonarensis TaxID=999151 RepID=UPI003D2A4A06
METDELRRLAIADWQEVLGGLTDEQIVHGLHVLDSDWPPSVTEFKKLCLGAQPAEGWEHNTAAYRMVSGQRGIEQKADKGKAKAALAQARQLMRPQNPREKQRQEADARRLLFGGDV